MISIKKSGIIGDGDFFLRTVNTILCYHYTPILINYSLERVVRYTYPRGQRITNNNSY